VTTFHEGVLVFCLCVCVRMSVFMLCTHAQFLSSSVIALSWVWGLYKLSVTRDL